MYTLTVKSKRKTVVCLTAETQTLVWDKCRQYFKAKSTNALYKLFEKKNLRAYVQEQPIGQMVIEPNNRIKHYEIRYGDSVFFVTEYTKGKCYIVVPYHDGQQFDQPTGTTVYGSMKDVKNLIKDIANNYVVSCYE